jgi:hypothetical protein
MYVTFGFVDSDCTIALAASIFRSATNASPALSSAREIVDAASASPSARITAACRSCSAFSTINFARSASARRKLRVLTNEINHTLLGNLLRFNSLREFLTECQVRDGHVL